MSSDNKSVLEQNHKNASTILNNSCTKLNQLLNLHHKLSWFNTEHILTSKQTKDVEEAMHLLHRDICAFTRIYVNQRKAVTIIKEKLDNLKD